MSIRNAYLPVLDRYRGALDTVWGLRLFDVSVRVNTWSPGTLPGQQGATKTPATTPLLCNGARVKVEQLSQRDVIASAGLYQDQDVRIGPLTPPYTDPTTGDPAGVDPSVFDPVVSGAATEIRFLINGPGFASAWYRKVGQELVSGNLHFHLVVRKTGETSV